MRKLSILVLALSLILAFSFGVMADEHLLWTDNAGTDTETGNGWEIDEGTLDGWSDSNFDVLEYEASGKSEEVGIGITVEGIKVDWKYPGGPDDIGFIGKGDGDIKLDQSIDYTIVAFAEIPCVLKMNVFGNGAYAEGISVGDGSEFSIEGTGLGNEGPTTSSHFMIFDPDYGGILNENWEFETLDAIDYATDMGDADIQGAEAYINACDLWTADLWANVPYGFTVSSTGLGVGYLAEPLLIEMRYLERVGAGIVSDTSNLPPYDDNGDNGDNGNIEVTANGSWVEAGELDDDGVEVGEYEAGQNAHINMQFRVPVNGAPAGRYQGEVTFSTYTI